MTLERGALLNNRYRVVEILGQGGMGAVYRAVDENLGVQVAVKENLFTTEEFARQFHREAVILANLRHPNLPRVTDHFTVIGQGQYLVMDFIEGEDLRERMDRLGCLTDEEVVVLGVVLCDALSYLHSRDPSVLHRDIKPGNVKISPSGHICLVDFGLAKVVQGGETTTTGARAMTPGYSPPEQYGTARTDHRTDIYSLGATLYVALTGVIPEDALARAMGQEQLTQVRKYNAKVSRRLAGLIEKALALRPEDRFQSAEEMKQALLNARVITGKKQPEELVLSPPPPTPPSEPLKLVRSSQGNGGGSVAQLSAPPGGSQSSLIPTSSLVDEPAITVSKRQRTKGRLGCWLTAMLISLVFLGIAGAVYYQPEWANQAIAWVSPYFPAFGREPLAETIPPGETTIPPTETPTPSPSVTATPEADQGVVLVESSPTRTPTPEPTDTPEPTETPTFTETPTGGGMGQIAYASNLTGLPQIWLVNVDGTGRRQLTDMPEGACQPDWSPDGSKIVFISPCAFNQEMYPGASLFIINVNGMGLTPLPTMPGGDFDPVWSLDGTRIAFTSLRDYNRPQIYVIHLEDSTVESISANTVRDMHPSWSPDGSRIAFITTRRGPYAVWIMDSDGSNPVLFSRSGSLRNSHPVWAPDGQLIMFTQNEVLGGVPRLVAARLGDGIPMETRVVRDRTPMREGVFSPDGFWIAYEGWPDGANHSIFIMTANGLARQQLTTDEAYDFDPAWRPAAGQP